MENRGGRYCETAVDESTKESNTRSGLMFYELNSWDWQGSTPWKRDSGGNLAKTWQGDMNILATIQRLVSKDVTPNNDHGASSAANRFKRQAGGFDKLLPDGYGRVFHPQIKLHRLIANTIIYAMAMDRQRRVGFGDVALPKTCSAGPATKALNIILEHKSAGIPGGSDTLIRDWNWLFYSVMYGTSSTCSNNPAPVLVTKAPLEWGFFNAGFLGALIP